MPKQLKWTPSELIRSDIRMCQCVDARTIFFPPRSILIFSHLPSFPSRSILIFSHLHFSCFSSFFTRLVITHARPTPQKIGVGQAPWSESPGEVAQPWLITKAIWCITTPKKSQIHAAVIQFIPGMVGALSNYITRGLQPSHQDGSSRLLPKTPIPCICSDPGPGYPRKAHTTLSKTQPSIKENCSKESLPPNPPLAIIQAAKYVLAPTTTAHSPHSPVPSQSSQWSPRPPP